MQCERDGCSNDRGRNKRFCSRACQKGAPAVASLGAAQRLIVDLGVEDSPEAMCLLRAAEALDACGADKLVVLLREVRLATLAVRELRRSEDASHVETTVSDEVKSALRVIDGAAG